MKSLTRLLPPVSRIWELFNVDTTVVERQGQKARNQRVEVRQHPPLVQVSCDKCSGDDIFCCGVGFCKSALTDG